MLRNSVLLHVIIIDVFNCPVKILESMAQAFHGL